MPHVTLKEYAAEIAQLVEQNKVEPAIAHCRHILTHYPRYLVAYRLLAHACLQKGDYAHAGHFFQSTLSADPEDADAWMNLAILSDDLGELEQATWLMERAFEVEPGHARVRSLLRQLYSRRDGIERTRIKLTPGALARLYASGGFHKRAVKELEALLRDSTELPPLYIAHLEVALAKSLWHSEGMAPMADKICQSLITKFPNCIQANLIMGQIRASAGMDDEAAPYLQVAQELDPEGELAHLLLGDMSPLPLQRVTIPYLEDTTSKATETAPLAAPETKDTSWLDQVGEPSRAPIRGAPPAHEPEAPDWLQDWIQDQPALPIAAETDITQTEPEETEPEAETLVTSQAQVPTWLSDAVQEPIAEAEVPDWLQELEPESSQDAPQWLQDLQTEDELSKLKEETAKAAQPVVADETLEGDSLGWLEDIAPEDWVAEEEFEPVDSAALPNWLAELSDEPADQGDLTEQQQPATQATAIEAEHDVPDWLRSLSPEVSEAQPKPAALDMDEPESELPGWLTDLESDTAATDLETGRDRLYDRPPNALASPTEQDQAVVDRVDQVAPVTDEQMPEMSDWVSQLEAAGAGEAIDEPEQAIPDWLSELGQTDLEQPETAAIEEAAEPLTKAELPDWLAELGPEPTESDLPAAPTETTVTSMPEEMLEDLPDWLREFDTEFAEQDQPAISQKPAVGQESAEIPEAEESLQSELAVPDWLSELQEQRESEEPEIWVTEGDEPAQPLAAEELPDWLQELRPGSDELDQPTLIQPAVSDVLPQPVEDVPDWLADLQVESLGDDQQTALVQESTAESEPITDRISVESTQPACPALPPPVAGMPGWLTELEADIGRKLGQVVDVPVEETLEAAARKGPLEVLAQPQVEPDETGEEPVAPYEEAELEEPAVSVQPETISEADQPPEWLRLLEADVNEQSIVDVKAMETADEFTTQRTAEQAADALEWLTERKDEQISEITIEEMPEWLQQVHEIEDASSESLAPSSAQVTDQAGEHELEWLRELEEMQEPGLTDLAQAEPPQEEAPLPSIYIEEPLLPAEQQLEPDQAQPYRKEPIELSKPSPEIETTLQPDAGLAEARLALRQDDPDRSAQEYERLVQMPGLVETVIEDLESAVISYPGHHALQRILGDAYMRAGQLHKALDAYREALTKL